jgi:hypothetical protein
MPEWSPHDNPYGNLLTPSFAPPPIQAKLTVGAVGDKYEQEADNVAAQVVKTINQPQGSVQPKSADEGESLQMQPQETLQREEMPEEDELQMKSESIQREEMPEEDELQMKSESIQREGMPEEDELQMKPTLQRVGHAGGAVTADLESEIQSARGSGQSLAPELQQSMGQTMGADFSGVKVHTDSRSNQLNQSIQAKAFTTGQDVFFSQGEYNPGSKGGQELIAHELTHVVQQTGANKRKQNDSISTQAKTGGLQKRGIFWGATQSDSHNQGTSLWGISQQSSKANLFAKQDIEFANNSGLNTSPDIQRYKTSAGFFSNKVKFESTALNAVLPGALNIAKTGNNVLIGSQWYGATGTVKASGAKAARVGKYQVGFLQTVYKSSRTGYYEPDPYNPSLGQKIGTAILPSLLGDRRKFTDLCKPLPVRDGDTGDKPWYESGDVADFDNAKVSNKSTRIDDQPETTFDWTKNVGGKTQNLVKTRGQDVFRSWLSVQKRGTTGFMGMHRLGYIDWKVDYGTDVTYNNANPAASIVTPTANSGGQIIGVHEGPGLKLPLMGDPTANDVAKDVESKW